MDPEVHSDRAHPLDVPGILEKAVGRVFLLPDFEAFKPGERRDIQVAAPVDVIRRLSIPSLRISGTRKE